MGYKAVYVSKNHTRLAMLNSQAVVKLDTLTSLRFFAAAMIVVGHASDLLGSAALSSPFAWGQGVTFFFVLSGFILAYNCSELSTRSDVKHFWLARFARIWPLHIATILLVLIALPTPTPFGENGWNGLLITLANLSLTQAWVPSSAYYFSYNSPAWTISTEFFFYLLFPLIIYRWSTTWHIKLFASLSVLLALFVIGESYALDTDYKKGFSLIWLVYINPLARIFEFILGISACSIYTWLNAKRGRLSVATATVFEILIIFFVYLFLWYVVPDTGQAVKVMAGESVAVWWERSGGVLLFPILVIIFALQQGLISRLLQQRPLILLGEISYALYLVHQIVLRYYTAHQSNFWVIPQDWLYAVFWGFVLLLSYLMYSAIERPCRRFITGLPKRRRMAAEFKGKENGRTWREWFTQRDGGRFLPRSGVPTALSALVLSGVVLATALLPPNSQQLVTTSEADQFLKRSSYKIAQNIAFGENLQLVALDFISVDSENYKLKLIWNAVNDVELKYNLAMHLINGSREIIFNVVNRPQHPGKITRNSGDYWSETVTIPKQELDKALGMTIVIWIPPDIILTISGGQTDWNERRLLVWLKNNQEGDLMSEG
jgi:peptidoglycan/LPS O-acetylase OafA/YrhL